VEDKYKVVLVVSALGTCCFLIQQGHNGLIVGALCTLMGLVAGMLKGE